MYRLESKPSVLIVHTDATIRILLGTALRHEFEVDTAHNGANALRKITTRRYDLVLHDFGYDGSRYIVCTRIRPGDDALKTVFATLDKDTNSRLPPDQAGGDAYIIRTSSLSELIRRLKSLLAERSPPAR